jgi:predicted nucleic acid-binding protein
MRRFLTGLVDSDIELVSLTPADLVRVNQLQENYADTRLDFTDTALIAMAERLDIDHICTFDRRDFSIIHPLHATSFTLLP